MLFDHIAFLDFNFDKELLWHDYNNCRKVNGANSALAHREDFKYGKIEHIPTNSENEGARLFKHIESKIGLSKFVNNRTPIYFSFIGDSFLQVHKDSMSGVWIAMVITGQQPIYFYNDDKQLIGHTQYECAMVNGFKYHEVPIKDTKIERLLLRQYYDCSFQEARSLAEKAGRIKWPS